MWIDSHCHLDAPEFDADREQVIARARQAGVMQMVIPAVALNHLDALVTLAHKEQLSYALGIHPLWMGADLPPGQDQKKHDLQMIQQLRTALEQHVNDTRLVAIGEIGLDYFVSELNPERQWFFYTEQLKLAREFKLPVILHVRKSADMLLKGLRQFTPQAGIAHAFNGSIQQAQAFIDMGFKLGFGGACTFERAHQLRLLVKTIPLENIVLETDAPDMPPHWLYETVEDRAKGVLQGRNEPAQLPRIAQVVAELRQITVDKLAQTVMQNTLQALPRLKQHDVMV